MAKVDEITTSIVTKVTASAQRVSASVKEVASIKGNEFELTLTSGNAHFSVIGTHHELVDMLTRFTDQVHDFSDEFLVSPQIHSQWGEDENGEYRDA